jgi:hypothetical protein
MPAYNQLDNDHIHQPHLDVVLLVLKPNLGFGTLVVPSQSLQGH